MSDEQGRPNLASTMPEEQASDPNLVEKLEAKVNDIDDMLIRSYDAYLDLGAEYQRVVLEYEKKMEAANILEKARAELREKEMQMKQYRLQRHQQRRLEYERRTGSKITWGQDTFENSSDDEVRRAIDRSLQHASGQTSREVQSGTSRATLVDISARDPASRATWNESPSRSEDTDFRRDAGNDRREPKRESMSQFQEQPHYETTSQPRSVTNTTAREPKFTALPPPVLSPPPRPRSSSDDAGSPGRAQTHVSTSHVRSNSYDDIISHRQNEIPAEALRNPESGQRPVAGDNYYQAMMSHQRSQPTPEPVRKPESKKKTTKTKDRTPYVPRITAESEAALEAERREFRNKIKAKFFGGSSKG